MAGNARDGNQKAIDAADIRCHTTASMYIRGKSYAEIAKHLGVTTCTIKNDMKRARKAWRNRASRTYARHLHEQLARLDEIEIAAWLGWERSLKDELQTGTEDGETPMGPISKTKVMRRNQSGNASFLKIMIDTVRQRSELLGLLDPDSKVLGQDDIEVVSVVIGSREDAEELRTISLAEYRIGLQASAEVV